MWGKAGKGDLREQPNGAESAAEDAGKIVETSYGKSSLIELKNTDNFMDSTYRTYF